MSATQERRDREQLTSWLNEARRGNGQAFRRLYTPESQRRWRLAAESLLPARLRAKVDPDDIVSEALVQAWRDLQNLRDVSTRRFHRWVSSILRHRVDDIVRHHGRAKRDVCRQVELPGSSVVGALGHDRTPSKSVARREQLARIVAALDELDKPHREVILLRILEGYSTREVAERMGDTIDNVAVKLHRALAKFRDLAETRGLESTLFRPPGW